MNAATIASMIAILLGGVISLFNWYSLYATRRNGKKVSAVPLIGAIFLTAGLLGMPWTRHYAWLGWLLDYGTLEFVRAIPTLVTSIWQVSTRNLLHRFEGELGGRKVDVRLFKRGVFTIRCVYDPAVPCNDQGALIQTFGFQGKWRSDDDIYFLTDYADDRELTIKPIDGSFATTERHYPVDKKYPYDKLDGQMLASYESGRGGSR